MSGMAINVAKSVSVIFNRTSLPGVPPNFTYRSGTLPMESEFKYLGILFSDGTGCTGGRRRGHTTPGCTHKAGELQAVGGRHAFHAMWRRCVQLNMWNVRTLCYLFDALVKPGLSYGCEVWAPALIFKCIQGGG